MPDLSPLIQRLQEAEEPYPRLDADIYRALGYEVDRMADGYIVKPAGAIMWQPVPRVTESIDAALSLVPEGWQWSVSNRAPEPHAGRAYIHNLEHHFVGISDRPNPKRMHEEETAATPALALCIAALQARQAMDPPQTQEGE